TTAKTRCSSSTSDLRRAGETKSSRRWGGRWPSGSAQPSWYDSSSRRLSNQFSSVLGLPQSFEKEVPKLLAPSFAKPRPQSSSVPRSRHFISFRGRTLYRRVGRFVEALAPRPRQGRAHLLLGCIALATRVVVDLIEHPGGSLCASGPIEKIAEDTRAWRFSISGLGVLQPASRFVSLHSAQRLPHAGASLAKRLGRLQGWACLGDHGKSSW